MQLNILYRTLISFIFIGYMTSSINIRIMKFPIIPIFPTCVKHHYLVISKTNSSDGVYVVDYSPITPMNETVLKTRINLLLGNPVPAEIRIRFIRDAKFNEDQKILKSDDFLDVPNPDLSLAKTEQVFKEIKDEGIKMTICTILHKCNNNYQMRLYKYNCQDFCKHALDTVALK